MATQVEVKLWARANGRWGGRNLLNPAHLTLDENMTQQEIAASLKNVAEWGFDSSLTSFWHKNFRVGKFLVLHLEVLPSKNTAAGSGKHDGSRDHSPTIGDQESPGSCASYANLQLTCYRDLKPV
jgi:hypothetical protein